jgi:hypothetical protein
MEAGARKGGIDLTIDKLPMRRIIDSQMADLDNGRILSYYLSEQWEVPLRNDFECLAEAYAAGPVEEDFRNDVLGRLNYGYRTRCKLSALYQFGDVVASLLEKQGWWQQTPPALFGSSDLDAQTLASVPLAIISEMADRKLPRPYSLSTKYLHFLFPDSFPIYDQRAAASIQAWAYFAVSDRDAAWASSSWSHVWDFHRNGYAGVIDFYRLFWTTATAEERNAVTSGAATISSRIGARVSTLDVLDKLLWRANGDPRMLGFRLA